MKLANWAYGILTGKSIAQALAGKGQPLATEAKGKGKGQPLATSATEWHVP